MDHLDENVDDHVDHVREGALVLRELSERGLPDRLPDPKTGAFHARESSYCRERSCGLPAFPSSQPSEFHMPCGVSTRIAHRVPPGQYPERVGLHPHETENRT